MRTILALSLLLSAIAPTLALAQDGDASSRDMRVESFDDELVPGERMSPDGDMIPGRIRGRRHTLIVPRAHFTPEMLRSIENL